MKRSDTLNRKLMDRLLVTPQAGPLMGFLTTTYEMQSEFFETDFLPAILGLGAWDDRNWTSRIGLERELAMAQAAVVLMDPAGFKARPRSLRVEVVPCGQEKWGRVLHAKVTVIVHENEIRLLVGSSNITEPGYRLNREVACALSAGEKKTEQSGLILQALQGMIQILSPWWTPSAEEVLNQARQRLVIWQKDINDNADTWFAWGGGGVPLWQQFVERWPLEEPVRSISIVSPFWSEESGNGPLALFIQAIKERVGTVNQMHLRLLAEAFPVSTKEELYRPILPETYESFTWKELLVRAFGAAVDPRVDREDVERDDITKFRPLHAKVVLLEGETTSLCYLGSANFTHHGWGFLADPFSANIEAGLIVKRTGKEREALRTLLPKTIGEEVSLGDGLCGKIKPPTPTTENLPWPVFLKEVVLTPSQNDPRLLMLSVTWDSALISDAWSILLQDQDEKVLFNGNLDDRKQSFVKIPLDRDVLELLMKTQEVLVRWPICPEGRTFPINVALEARTDLPITPGNFRPGESLLLAYYQGRITWEDLFPPLESEPCNKGNHVESYQTGVDTSKIQSYQVREFVEALRGIEEDLMAAAQATESAMKLALVGPVSPVALSRTIMEAVDLGDRTPIAAGFQLVELQALLRRAAKFGESGKNQEKWRDWTGRAEKQIQECFSSLRKSRERLFGPSFSKYSQKILEG